MSRMPNEHLERKDYTELAKIARRGHSTLTDILNRNGLEHWTICPHCKITGFKHVEDCPLLKDINKSPTRTELVQRACDPRQGAGDKL